MSRGLTLAYDGTRTPLTTAISYEHRRAGERSTAPPFDLIAANGGRVIAKARGVDRFYFTTMDEMFVRESDGDDRELFRAEASETEVDIERLAERLKMFEETPAQLHARDPLGRALPLGPELDEERRRGLPGI